MEEQLSKLGMVGITAAISAGIARAHSAAAFSIGNWSEGYSTLAGAIAGILGITALGDFTDIDPQVQEGARYAICTSSLFLASLLYWNPYKVKQNQMITQIGSQITIEYLENIFPNMTPAQRERILEQLNKKIDDVVVN